MENFWPADCPAEAECSECGAVWQVDVQSYSNDTDDELSSRTPTSKRRQRQYWCGECGHMLAEILDPHWPGGASGGYVENPPEDRL